MERKLPFVVDLNDYGALLGIPIRRKGHAAGNAGEILDTGQGVLDLGAVRLDLSGQSAGVLDSLYHETDNIPG